MVTSSSSSDDVKKVAELLGDERIGMLTTSAPDGTLTSRPMAVQEVDPGGDVWLFADKGSGKLDAIATHPQVNFAMSTASTWVSLAGRAEVVEDAAKKRELWNAGADAWFPDGQDDPDIVLVKIDGESAEYWDTPGGRISTLLSFAKTRIAGEPRKDENARVELT